MARHTTTRSPSALYHLVHSDRWNGFAKGDLVVVIEPDSKINGITYEFMSYVTNVETGVAWIDLWGGPPRHAAIRSVKRESIRKKVDRRRTR